MFASSTDNRTYPDIFSKEGEHPLSVALCFPFPGGPSKGHVFVKGQGMY
ncbi:hypothetical protein I7I48_04680 [Histoplasma ohiense]|nr:hypothetical protein I7I48_04680 [Histoplasma ohiense (nom. inval.)]